MIWACLFFTIWYSWWNLWSSCILDYVTFGSFSLDKGFSYHRSISSDSNNFDYLRLKIRVVCEGNFILKCLLIEFVIPNLSQNYFCLPKLLKRMSNTGFWIQCHLLNLCSRVVNSQRLLCSKKAGVKCSY